MTYLDPNTPYIAVPSWVHEVDFQQAAASFRAIPNLQVARCDRVLVRHAAPIEPTTASEITYWIVNFGPDLLRQVAVWALSTYAGKKLIDGFATEAGKDLWKGVKALSQILLEKFNKDKSYDKQSKGKFIDLHAIGWLSDDSVYYDVSITLRIPTKPAVLVAYLDAIEGTFYPLVGCLSAKLDYVSLRVDPGDRYGWPWTIWRLLDGRIFGVDPLQRTYRQLSEGAQDLATQECLQQLGMKQAARRK